MWKIQVPIDLTIRRFELEGWREITGKIAVNCDKFEAVLSIYHADRCKTIIQNALLSRF